MLERFFDWLTNLFSIKVKEIKVFTGKKKCLDLGHSSPSPIANIAGTYIQGKMDKQKAETDVKVARAKAEAKVYETEATSSMLMEQNLTNQMAGSWKDEFWTIIFGGILVACFLTLESAVCSRGFYLPKRKHTRLV